MEQNRMKKISLFVGIFLRIIAFSLVFIIVFVVCKECSMRFLPTGDLIDTYCSPQGNYQINIYLCNGGATTGYSIRGELVNSIGNKKNIYWQNHRQTAEVKWLDDNTVVINGITLDVRYDVYDYRRHK